MDQLAIPPKGFVPRHDAASRAQPAPSRAESRFEPPKPDAKPAAPVADQRRLNLEIDAATGTVIFQSISEATGDVVNQYPNDAQLNLRAYLASLELAKPADGGGERG
ncbi:MAG: hypothetical protein AB7G34_17400 [Hyphomicrobiales bacterium]